MKINKNSEVLKKSEEKAFSSPYFLKAIEDQVL